MAEGTADQSKGDAAKTAEKKATKKPTLYLVQRRLDEGGTDEYPHWADVRRIEANDATKAIKDVAGYGDEAVGGQYRALPVSSDNQLTVVAKQQTVIDYSEPSANGAAAGRKEPARA